MSGAVGTGDARWSVRWRLSTGGEFRINSANIETGKNPLSGNTFVFGWKYLCLTFPTGKLNIIQRWFGSLKQKEICEMHFVFKELAELC